MAVSALLEQLSLVVPVEGSEILSMDDCLNVTDYLRRVVESIDASFLAMELRTKKLAEKAPEDLVEEDFAEMRLIERLVASGRKDTTDLPLHLSRQSDYLKHLFLLAKSSSRAKAIAELISRFKAVLQDKALETRL